jgi:hypothetical protein
LKTASFLACPESLGFFCAVDHDRLSLEEPSIEIPGSMKELKKRANTAHACRTN